MNYVYRKYAEKMQKGTVNRNKNCPSAKDLERFIYSETVKRNKQLASVNYAVKRTQSAWHRGDPSVRLPKNSQKNYCFAQGGQSRLTFEAAATVKRKVSWH